MKRLAVALFIWVVLAAMFIVGVFSTSTVPVMASFCLWTPATLFLGWSLAKGGVKISVGMERNSEIGMYEPDRIPKLTRRKSLLSQDLSS